MNDPTADLPRISTNWGLRTYTPAFDMYLLQWRGRISSRVLAHAPPMTQSDHDSMIEAVTHQRYLPQALFQQPGGVGAQNPLSIGCLLLVQMLIVVAVRVPLGIHAVVGQQRLSDISVSPLRRL